MEVKINQVVLHLLDPGASEPVLSDRAMDMDADLYEYYTATLERAFASDEVKNCRFLPDSAFAAEMAQNQDFIDLSRRIAGVIFEQMLQYPAIPAGDLAVVDFTADGVPFYGVLKLNYRPGYTHHTELMGNGRFSSMVPQRTLLPGTPEICITGGAGVGRVTKPGLDQPVGQAAINHVPRQMITEALRREAEAACYPGGFAVTISIPGGEEVARRTFNPHIGVEGGLSVLGTSGIVEPMSQQAILDTIQLEMNQAALRAKDHRRLILAPGNYGLDYLHETYPQFADIPVVKTSNFIGDTLDMAAAAHFEQVLLVGHIGKLCKLAGGIMNTHSHTADCRTELFCTHAALCGADREVCTALYNAATTDACLVILDTAGLREPVLQSLLAAIQLHLDRRTGGAFRVGAVLFSNQHGPLGQTETAARLLDEWKE